MRKRILFISNLFPNSTDLHFAAFNRQQLIALSSVFNIDVVSPIPWPKKIFKSYSYVSKVLEIEALHPTYYYFPMFFRGFHGLFFYYSLYRAVSSLISKKEYHAIYSSWIFPDSWAAARIAKKFDIPLIVKVHGTDVNRLVPGSKLTALTMSTVASARKVICVSNALRDHLVLLGADPGNLEVVYNGVDSKVFTQIPQIEARVRLGIIHEAPILLYVGNLKKDKGLRELALAFGAIKANPGMSSVRLVVIGQGPFGAAFKAMLETLGVTKDVLFTGTIGLDSVALWMSASNALCLPSYREGVPNVILEAMACNLPVVATNVGGIPELLDYGSLYLCEPKDVETLTALIFECLKVGAVKKSGLDLFSWKENAKILTTFLNC